MMALLYILVSTCLGAGIILCLEPYLKTAAEIVSKPGKTVSPAFIFIPSSYLVGTFILSWVTYFLAVAFRNCEKPLLYANIISLVFSFAFLPVVVLLNRSITGIFRGGFLKDFLNFNLKPAEWFVLISSFLFWTYFICRSFYMDGDNLCVGYSAFSDFGAHLPVIRSFSAGRNYPAQYPHFPDGTMRYLFMFYFMAANLEFLGLTLPQALNIPSILSLVCFSMLLYSLCVFLTKKPTAGILSCILFAFRSSYAFFTYMNDFSDLGSFLQGIAKNLNADGSYREHIGKTLHEDWGLWAQKVYINQRHLSFAFGLFIVVLFLMLPFFIETINRIKSAADSENKPEPKQVLLFKYIELILFSREAWAVKSITPCIVSGIILGLMAYWNGAVVIAGISVLFVMAILSMQKLGYLVTAIITFILSVLQSRIFAGSGTGVVSPGFNPGFLAESGRLKDILSYYTELLGILPLILAGIFIFFVSQKSKPAVVFLSIVLLVLHVSFMPSVGEFRVVAILSAVTLCYVFLIFWHDIPNMSYVSLWLVPVFIAPVILATTLQLTPDITVNHKYIILSVILLNIPVSDLLTGLIKSKSSCVIAVYLVFILTCTGFVDMITLHNLDRNSVRYSLKDELYTWVKNETNPDDIFLTHYMTHYGAPMSIMLAGRSVYNGYPYFTITAGYDITGREECMKKIYSARDSGELRTLALSEGIDYIVVEDQNRNATEYNLNEGILYETFSIAFHNNRVTIFKVR